MDDKINPELKERFEAILDKASQEVCDCSFEDLVNDGEDGHKISGIGISAKRTAIDAMHSSYQMDRDAQNKYIKDLERVLEGFVDSCYTGCTKDGLNQLRINAEKVITDNKFSSPPQG